MENKNKIIIFLGILIIILVALNFIWINNFTGKSIKEEETIKIGAILPLSGKVAYYGDYIQQGTNAAINEINSKGGINNRKLEVIYEDSKGDVTSGISAYENLRFRNVSIIITTLSGVTLGIAPISQKDKVILMNIGSASPKISNAGDYVFRHNVLPQEEIKFLANYLYNNGYKEIALITVNAEAGVSYRDYFIKEYERLGGKIIVDEMHEYGETDYRSILAKIKDKKPKAVLVLSYPNELAAMLKQSQELDFKTQWFSIYDKEGSEFLELAGENAEGLIYTHFLKENEKFTEPYAALAYDSIMVLAQAMENCKNPEDTTCIKESLYSIKDFSGVTGKISFDKNGDTHKEIILKTIKDGKFVNYES